VIFEAIAAFPREHAAERDEDDGGTTQGAEVQPASRLPFLRGDMVEVMRKVQSMEEMAWKNDDKHGNTGFFDVS
jgi:hypothetical protein